MRQPKPGTLLCTTVRLTHARAQVEPTRQRQQTHGEFTTLIDLIARWPTAECGEQRLRLRSPVRRQQVAAGRIDVTSSATGVFMPDHPWVGVAARDARGS